MSRKNLPLLLMLVAGAITCIITYIMDYSLTAKLVSLFLVMLLFCFLGSVLMWTLDFFDKQNQEKKKAEQDGEEMDAEEEYEQDDQEQDDQEQTADKVEITEEET